MTVRRSRAIRIFGTGETVEPPQELRAGPLSAVLDRGSVRYIRWQGFEIVRGVAFVLRDTDWGTYAPTIEDLNIGQSVDGFRVAYRGAVASPDGDFRFQASITGLASGKLIFAAEGESRNGFATARTGFVVLHPLDGVCGRPFIVGHPDGRSSQAEFGTLIDPLPPATDIISIDYEPAPGLTLGIRFRGDSFEMEDHRNWTDASFKTYVRPLSWGYPYRIAPAEELQQSIEIEVTGVPSPTPAEVHSPIVLRTTTSRIPKVGMFLDDLDVSITHSLAAIAPAFVVGRVDATAEDLEPALHGCASTASAFGCPLDLEVIIDGRDPTRELAPLATLLRAGRASPTSIVVFPRRDLGSRPPNVLPAGEASAEEIAQAARAAFPGISIGSGVPVGFAELNRNRPARKIDFVTHASQATFHAADDVSVMETLETIPHLAASIRAMVGNAGYRIAPATIGLPSAWCAGAAAPNPQAIRLAMAREDPRQRGLFAAAFALGFVAAAAEAGLEALAIAAPHGAFGATEDNGAWRPIALIVSGIAALSGRPRFELDNPSAHIAALAASTEKGPVLWLANLSAEPTSLMIGTEIGLSTQLIMDAKSLSRAVPDAIPERPFTGGALKLDSYAVCRLR